MTSVLQVAHFALLLVFIVLGSFSVQFLRTGTALLSQLKSDEAAGAKAVSQDHAAARAYLAKVTAALCDPRNPSIECDVHKTLGTIRGSFGQVELAANAQRAANLKLNQQAVTLLQRSTESVVSLNSFLTSSEQTMRSLKAVADSIVPVTNMAKEDLQVLHDLLADPKIVDMVKQSDGTLANLEAITAVARKKADAYGLPPTKKDQVMTWFLTALKVYFYVK